MQPTGLLAYVFSSCRFPPDIEHVSRIELKEPIAVAQQCIGEMHPGGVPHHRDVRKDLLIGGNDCLERGKKCRDFLRQRRILTLQSRTSWSNSAAGTLVVVPRVQLIVGPRSAVPQRGRLRRDFSWWQVSAGRPVSSGSRQRPGHWTGSPADVSSRNRKSSVACDSPAKFGSDWKESMPTMILLIAQEFDYSTSTFVLHPRACHPPRASGRPDNPPPAARHCSDWRMRRCNALHPARGCGGYRSN